MTHCSDKRIVLANTHPCARIQSAIISPVLRNRHSWQNENEIENSNGKKRKKRTEVFLEAN